jgi:AI-2 transport protein TqsA
MADIDRIRNRLLAVILVVLLAAGLRATYAVSMPLAAALVIIAAVWPLKPWLDRLLPSKLSYVATILIVLIIAIVFIGALYLCAAQIVAAFGKNQDLFDRMYHSLLDAVARWGLRGSVSGASFTDVVETGQTLLSNAYTTFGYVGFIAVLVIFGLPEVPTFRRKLHQMFDATNTCMVVDAVDKIAERIRQYLGITLITSVITGVASALWAYATGLELALVWGMLNFLLNFIPIIGNIVGILPPTLYAIVQFQSTSMAVLVFAGFAILQIVISNFVYPWLQGERLSLPPIVIILSLAFWSWVWGIAGALIAVPLTAALVIAFDHFRGTRWIAQLLSNSGRPD